jgi:hypothetical protein
MPATSAGMTVEIDAKWDVLWTAPYSAAVLAAFTVACSSW